MASLVELREIRVFLTLAEELNFARTAERLRLTPSRVSQVIRELEAKLGAPLFTRTSRRVMLTGLGEQFRARVSPAFDQLAGVLDEIEATTRSVKGIVRVGLLAASSGGPQLNRIIERFERVHPDCEVEVSEVMFGDALGPLRRGEIDAMATRLPIEQPDLVVGPTLRREPRVLAVATDHPLAARDEISIEDVADYPVAPITDSPPELIDTMIPRTTPGGRRIRRLSRRPSTPHEVTALVAKGTIVHPTVPSFPEYFGQPGVTYIPITDMPASKSGLIWRRGDRNPRLREFIRVARQVLGERSRSRASTRS